MRAYFFVCWISVSLIGSSCFGWQAAEQTAAPNSAAPASGAAPETASEWASLVVYPATIKLSSKTDSQHVIAVATRKDGVTTDVTDQVAWTLDTDTFVDWKDFVVSPKADGASRLTATWNGMSSSTEITATNSQVINPIHFEKDVMPILTKAGCNTGSCHGAARGKDGFRLSLSGTIRSVIISVSLVRLEFDVSIWRCLNKVSCCSKRLEQFSIPEAKRLNRVASTTTRF